MGHEYMECPKAPPTSFDDEDWDDLDWSDMDWDEQHQDSTPFFAPPQTPIPIDCEPELNYELCSAVDDRTVRVSDADTSALPWTVVEQARHKFVKDAPRGVTRVATSGTEFLCGLHAVRLSMGYQPSFQRVRQPSIKELLDIWEEIQRAMPEGNDNCNFFEVTQLARITQVYLGRQGVAGRLGVVSPSMGQILFPIIYSDMEEYKNAEKVLWVYNDEKGTHWEALRLENSDSLSDMEEYRRDLTDAQGASRWSRHSKSRGGRAIINVSQFELMEFPDAREVTDPASERPNDTEETRSPPPAPPPASFSPTTAHAPPGLAKLTLPQPEIKSTALTTSRAVRRLRSKTLSEGAITTYMDTPFTMSSLFGMRMVRAG